MSECCKQAHPNSPAKGRSYFPESRDRAWSSNVQADFWLAGHWKNLRFSLCSFVLPGHEGFTVTNWIRQCQIVRCNVHTWPSPFQHKKSWEIRHSGGGPPPASYSIFTHAIRKRAATHGWLDQRGWTFSVHLAARLIALLGESLAFVSHPTNKLRRGESKLQYF